MKATMLKGVALGAVVSSVTLMATAAFAGTGVGAIFNLGKTNTVNASTTLTGPTNGAQLRVVNTSAGTNAAGVGIAVAAGKAPLRVNSSVKVANLNSDLLDGADSSSFVRASHVLHGHADANTATATLLFLDPATGAAVRHHGGGTVEITNTNATAHLSVHGIDTLGGFETHWDSEIMPGATAEFPEQTIDPTYLDLVVTRIGSVAANTTSMHLTCGVASNSTTGLVALSCIGLT